MFDFATVDTAHSSSLLDQGHSFTNSFHQNDYAFFANFQTNSQQLSTWEADYFSTTTLPTLTLRANDTQAAETLTGQTANPGQFTFTRTGDLSTALTAYYSVTGTATNGQDYDMLTGSVNFAVGASTAIVNLRPIDDTLFEGNERVTLTLANNASYTVGTANTGTVTITDNDQPTLTLTANDSNASETLTGQTANSGQFTLTRNGNLSNSLIAYYTVTGTATNGTDYQNLTGSVTFAAGASTATINLNVLDDTLFEGNETVTLTLANNASYTVGTANTGTVTITDNDPLNTGVTLQSLVQTGTHRNDEGKSIAYDTRTGNYVVVGNSQALSGYGSWDSWAILYNNQGQALWRHDFATPDIPYSLANGGGGYYHDAVVNVTFDQNGNVILGGRSQFEGVEIISIGDPNNPNDDITQYLTNTDGWLQKLNGSTGSVAWSQRFNYGIEDWTEDITVDSQGNAYMVGYTNNGAFINKYAASNGALAWSQRIGNSSTTNAQAVTVDNVGNVYVAGKYYPWELDQGGNNSWLGKLDANGTILWTKEIVRGALSDEVADLGMDNRGNLYVTGKSVDYQAKTSDGWVIKLDSDGNQIWNNTRYGTSQQEVIYHRLAIDSQSNVYLAGEKVNNMDQSSSSSGILVKIDYLGIDQGETLLTSTTGVTSAYGIDLGHNGQIYLTGLTSGSLNGTPNAGLYDVFIAQYRQN